jgi:ubiquinone biosynthesis protein Coq4
MDIDVFLPHEFDTALRVLRTALNPQGALGAIERSFLDTYAVICGWDALRADPAPIDPYNVVIQDSHRRKRLVQLSALAVLLTRPVRPDSVVFLRRLAALLGTHDAVVSVVDALAKGQLRKVRLLATRRVMRVMLKEAYLAEGPMGVVRVLAAMLLKAPVNKDKLWNYKRLGLLAEGTLGREYWKHMTQREFGFPGDVAGIPDSISYHDVAHVLSGNDTTPAGEIQQGSFQGGNRREDGFFFIQMVILQFHQGVKVTPASEPFRDHFDPRKVLWAIHRGAQCNVDMTHQWNYWPLMALPLDQARARVHLLPKLDLAGVSPLPPLQKAA